MGERERGKRDEREEWRGGRMESRRKHRHKIKHKEQKRSGGLPTKYKMSINKMSKVQECPKLKSPKICMKAHVHKKEKEKVQTYHRRKKCQMLRR